MKRMDEDTFVCIDCETTGLDLDNDRVIEVAFMKFTIKDNLDTFESLIDPEYPISEDSIKIHHITPEMVAGKPKLSDVLPKLLELIGNHIIIGHGIQFDIEMLARGAERAGIAHTLRKNLSLDTLRMARLYGESPVNSLEQLRKHFNIEDEVAHRAMSDVVVNCEVFRYLSKRYRMTQQLLDRLKYPIKIRVMPLGKYKGRLMKDVPIEYLKWSAHKKFDDDLLFTIRSEINRRKKGNLFNQASNPFSSL